MSDGSCGNNGCFAVFRVASELVSLLYLVYIHVYGGGGVVALPIIEKKNCSDHLSDNLIIYH